VYDFKTGTIGSLNRLWELPKVAGGAGTENE
jgi:hypothetical protein